MALSRDDDYAGPGKPPCDWDDPDAREALVDALVRDALAALAALDGVELQGAARDAAGLLALVAGQDVEQGDDGVFRIARRVARDRVISTVDPEARHGHKSRNQDHRVRVGDGGLAVVLLLFETAGPSATAGQQPASPARPAASRPPSLRAHQSSSASTSPMIFVAW